MSGADFLRSVDSSETTKGLRVDRIYTKNGIHPYDEVQWVRKDVVLTNWRDGTVNFEQRGVEFPDFWADNAVNIVTSKYFRGALDSDQRENSLKQLIDRVVKKYVETGSAFGYFESLVDADIFGEELTYMLLHQIFSFNSPVWFNVGTSSRQQTSACYILSVEDTMSSILDWYREEGLIFKGGSGAGVNLSKIRSSKELLSTGGQSSGPVSFMRGADASAGTIKSGGKTRRAAKMVVLDVDHPDIEEFVESKAKEEDKIRALKAAGFDMDLGGDDSFSVQYQNANNSVRVSDKFMRAVEEDDTFDLLARKTGKTLETVKARDLWSKICTAAWKCADPGIQYDDTINSWHTCPESGRITASNPCSEVMFLDNSSCNLASVNLLKFLKDDNKSFDTEKFVRSVDLIVKAMEISICFGQSPIEKIDEVTREFRPLGIGYTNLGALLMASGLAYDSEAGRSLAAAVTSLMSAVSYCSSAEMAGVVGTYDGYARNADPHKKIIKRHANVSRYMGSSEVADEYSYLWNSANLCWDDAIKLGDKHGYRNANVSVLAPTGTIGLAMGCDTTGIEPSISLVAFKKLVGGGSMQIVNGTVSRALKSLGYQGEQIEAITEYIADTGHVVDAPALRKEHYSVFDCAMGIRPISPMGHVRMMAAVQPFISGAISKTVNMPETATVDDIAEVYMQGWKLGVKALAVYRDKCKVGQPLSDKSTEKEDDVVKEQEYKTLRKRLPAKRPSETYSFSVAGAEGYMTASSYPDNGLGEIFLKMSKQGSTLAGVMDAFAIAVSIGLQHGVPLETFVKKFTNMRFEPSGLTSDPDVRLSSSLVDYIFRRLALDYLPEDTRKDLGILSAEERSSKPSDEAKPAPVSEMTDSAEYVTDAPMCFSCGSRMRPAGSCYVCEGCGTTSGCS